MLTQIKLYQIVLEKQKQKSVLFLFKYSCDAEVSQNGVFVPFFSRSYGNAKNKTIIGIENLENYVTLYAFVSERARVVQSS